MPFPSAGNRFAESIQSFAACNDDEVNGFQVAAVCRRDVALWLHLGRESGVLKDWQAIHAVRNFGWQSGS